MRALESILVFALTAALVIAGCGSRAGQVTLKTGQCVLDTGVEAILLVDLADANYAQLVADAATKLGPTVVSCALQAIAATAPGAGSGSGSAVSARAEAVTPAQRAQVMLEKLGAR